MTTSALRFVVVLGFALCLIALADPEGREVASTSPEDAAIQEKLRQMHDGWRARDAELFASPFAVDADYVVVNGMRLSGRQAIEQGHRRLFARIAERDSETAEAFRDEVTIRYLRPDVALVHKVGYGTVPNIATLVLTKNAQGWEIAALQRTAIEEPSEERAHP